MLLDERYVAKVYDSAKHTAILLAVISIELLFYYLLGSS